MTTSDGFDSGVLSSLTDFGITRYATPRLVRILYILTFVVAILIGLAFLVSAFAQGGGMIVAGLIGAPLYVLLIVIYARVLAELVALLFTAGQNISRLVELAEARQGPGGGAAGSPETPPPPITPPAP